MDCSGCSRLECRCSFYPMDVTNALSGIVLRQAPSAPYGEAPAAVVGRDGGGGGADWEFTS